MGSDINYIIQMSLNGDKNYHEILLDRLKPLIFKNIYMYWDPMDPIAEDLEQEGYVLILESLKAYNQKRNVHFLQYVKIKIYYFYKNYFRKTRKDNNKSYSDDLICGEFPSCLDNLLEKENSNELYENIKTLSAIDREILRLYYYEQLTIREVSERLEMPLSTCSGRKKSAIKKLYNLARYQK
ncbi:RNA polymerase sigma factor [Sedimentibacter sp. LTW-03]|uniref:RNA polymerase sigma factor n=1 Tax=Sedimentibacter sp. LTW-03 TaxID=3453406 RepID=UPI003F86463B